MHLVALALLAVAPAPHAAQQPPPAPPPAPAAPAVKLPAEVKVAPGRLASIVIESNGKATKFGCLDSSVDLFREYDPADPSKIKVRLIAYTPGKYAVYAYTAAGDAPSDLAVCWLVVGDPTPPAPPTTPAPPPPADPLKVKLAVAFAAAAGTPAQKAEWGKDLAALYRQAAKVAGDKSVATVGALKEKLAAASSALVGADALREVRQAVAGELASVLPAADGPITDAQRTGAADLFTRLASVMEELSK